MERKLIEHPSISVVISVDPKANDVSTDIKLRQQANGVILSTLHTRKLLMLADVAFIYNRIYLNDIGILPNIADVFICTKHRFVSVNNNKVLILNDEYELVNLTLSNNLNSIDFIETDNIQSMINEICIKESQGWMLDGPTLPYPNGKHKTKYLQRFVRKHNDKLF